MKQRPTLRHHAEVNSYKIWLWSRKTIHLSSKVWRSVSVGVFHFHISIKGPLSCRIRRTAACVLPSGRRLSTIDTHFYRYHVLHVCHVNRVPILHLRTDPEFRFLLFSQLESFSSRHKDLCFLRRPEFLRHSLFLTTQARPSCQVTCEAHTSKAQWLHGAIQIISTNSLPVTSPSRLCPG